MEKTLYRIYTPDQQARFLVDDALFSDSPGARVRAVNQLTKDYRASAIPIIRDIIRTLPANDEVFRTFCDNAIRKIKEQDRRMEELEEWLGQSHSERQPV
jgi:hypothetical protein